MELLLLSAKDVRAALPMGAAIDVAEAAFAAQAEGRVVAPQRIVLPVGQQGGSTLVMPAYLPGGGLSTKVVSVFPENGARGLPTLSGLVTVLDEETGVPQALIDGAFLTAWRTAAAAGVATRWLAPPGAKVGVMLGAGAQASTQLLAMDATAELEVVRVWSREVSRAQALVSELADQVRARLEVVERIEPALEGAQLVVCATPATAPLFKAERLEAGAHLTSLGSFTAQMVEVDPALAADAKIFVDDRAAAEEEAGELQRAVQLGYTRAEDWIVLGDVVRGRATGRDSVEQRTWFKSVGLAVQDVATSVAVLAAAREQGLGRLIEL